MQVLILCSSWIETKASSCYILQCESTKQPRCMSVNCTLIVNSEIKVYDLVLLLTVFISTEVILRVSRYVVVVLYFG